MTGPWEDFQTPSSTEPPPPVSDSSPPWADFQRPAVGAQAPDTPPWMDFQRPQQQQSGQRSASTSPSLYQYPLELGKGAAEGFKANIASRLEGYGAGVAASNQKILDVMDRIDRGEAVTPVEDVIGYGDMTPELRKTTRDQLAQNLSRPVAQQPLYTAGQALESAGSGVTGPGKGFEGRSITRDIGSGIGSVGENILESMIPVVGPALMVPNLAAAGKGEAVERAVKAGATPEQQLQAASYGNVAGLTDVADALLPALGSTGKALGFLRKVGTRAVEGALTEGGQEGLQQYIQNAIAKGIYKPDQDIWEDVPYNTFIGAVVGGGTSSILGGHHEAGHEEVPSPQADTNASYTTLTGGQPQVSVQPGAPSTPTAPVATPTGAPEVTPPAPVSPALSPDTPVAPRSLDALTLARDDFDKLGPGMLNVETMMKLRDVGGEDLMQVYKNEYRRLTKENVQSTLTEPLSPDTTDGTRVTSTVAETPIETDSQPITTVIPNKINVEELPRDQSFFPAPHTVTSASENISRTVTPVHSAFLGSWMDDIGITPEASTSPLSAAVLEHTREKIKQIAPDVQVHIITPQDMEHLLAYKPGEAPLGAYMAGPGFVPRIFISGDVVSNPRALSHVVMHEGVHAASSRLMYADPKFAEAVKLLMLEAREKILAMPNENKEIPSWTTIGPMSTADVTFNKVIYAFKNEREFLAEAHSNPTLQHVLHNLKTSQELSTKLGLEGPKPSLWQAFVQLIRRTLGLESNLETYSLLESTLRVGSRIFDAQGRMPGDHLRPDNAGYVDGMGTNTRALGGSQVGEVGPTRFEKERDAYLQKNNLPSIGPEQNLRQIQGRIRQIENDRRINGTTDQPNTELSGLRKRLKWLSQVPATGIQPETAGIRTDLMSALGSALPPGPAEAAAHADRMNKFYKWMAGLDQLVQSNPNFTPLVRYKEVVQKMHLEESKLHDAALRIGKDWRRLGEEGDRLSQFLNDLTNMVYLSKIELDQGIARHPSAQEFQRLIDKHKIGPQGQEVFRKVKTLIDGFLSLIENNVAQRTQARLAITPEQVQAKQNALKAITEQMAALKSRPYFPFMRFGSHYLFIKDAAGKLIHFETFERHGLRSAERRQLARQKDLSRKLDPGHKITIGELPEAAGPLTGMPPLLLAQMRMTMSLTPDQLNAIDMLQLADKTGLTPVLSAKYQKRYFVPGYSVLVPGYSMDLKRSFAKYFFHGAKFYSKTKYADTLKDLVTQAGVPQKANWNTESRIAQYMNDHLQNTILDAKGDFGIFKGAIFLLAMGYVPAAAAQNLSQTPMITFPYLGGKFGDVAASREITKAMVELSSYYKRGTYDTMSAFEAKALGYGIKTGRISETQAPELAGMSQGANLLEGIGGNRVQNAWVMFQEKAAWMFEMAEQFNRRVAYRAALNLALQKPNAKIIKEALSFNSAEFEQLKAEGWTDAEARAVITASHITEQTQYTYARWARPRFMRGSLPGTLFVFKKYIQSTLFMLANNRTDVLPRYLLIAAFVGGMGGLPGMDDLKSLLKGIAAKLFGKNFDLDREARKYILQFSNGQVDPDLVLHGFARRGMGIPALLDLAGSFATGRPGRGLDAPRHVGGVPMGFANNVPFPVLDRSRALGMGQISPIDIGALMTPSENMDKTIADQTQKASGAVFSVGFNIYKAIMDQHNELSDWKRWERAVPRMIGDISKSWRAYSEGRERSKGGPAGGSTIVNYDPNDTEQMMEVLAMAAGYQPLRVQARWDNIMAKVEVEKFYDLQRSALLEQLYEARSSHRASEIEDVIKSIHQFNDQLPEEARGKKITSDTANKSVATRERARVSREAGVPTNKSNVPISREMDRLFPESTIDVRKR